MKKNSPKIKKGTLRRLLILLGRELPQLLAALILAAGSVLLALYVNVIIGRAIDLMAGENAVSLRGVADCIRTVAVCIGLSALFHWLMNLLLNRVAFSSVRQLRQAVFEKLQRVPVRFVDDTQPGEIISRVINDIEQISDGLIMGFASLFTGVVTVLGTLGFMFYLDWRIAPVVVVITPFTLLIARFIAKNTYRHFRRQSEENGALTANAEEAIGGISVIRAFSREKTAAEKFRAENERLRDAGVKAVFFSSIVNPTTRLINGTVYAGLGVLGSFAVLSGFMTVGLLSSFLAYANQFTKPFNEISGVIAEFQGALASAARVFEILDSEEVTEKENAARTFTADGNAELCGVGFSYRPDKPLIRDFNLSVKAGQRIAIVGPTGCGKTTLINLLMRFYEADTGEILLNRERVSVYDMTRDALRENYGMVLQETWLRTGTVRENIAMGKPDATDEEIEQAAREAYAHGFISRLPEGYDTVVAEDGANLSQGQKQLLCIARVMLALPPMLILDEATSSIDTRTEIRVQKAFARMMQGRTSFVVAHRLSTVSECDCILVMNGGRIVERGTHRELLAKDGFYRRLYESQYR